MYSLSKYNEITPCIRGNELLTSILDRNGVFKLWLNSEHVFISTKESGNLYAFDIVPQLRWRRSVQSTPNDCILDVSPEPVVEVIWDKSEPSFVFVVTESGTTNFWQFLRPSQEWIKHKSIQLSNAKGSQIIDVKWHKESGNLVWCEKRGVAADAYCVSYRSINIQDNEKVKIDIGTTQAILHNCPMVSIVAFDSGICIHPCQIYLEKIFMFWRTGRNVQAVVIKNGKVQESVTNISDFRDITTTLVGSWTEDADDDIITWLGVTLQQSTQDLLLLERSGNLFKLSMKSNILKLMLVCTFKLPLKFKGNFDQSNVFANGVSFGLIDCKSDVFIYDIVSGKLLQTFGEFSKYAGRVQVLESNCRHSVTVFWKSNGIWKLDCLPVTEIVKTFACAEDLNGDSTNELVSVSGKSDSNLEDVSPKIKEETISSERLHIFDVVKWLCMFGLKHSAMVLLLEHVISCNKKGEEIPETTLQSLKQLGKEVLQNPSILFTLFEQDLSFKAECRRELKQFLDEIDQATVPSVSLTPLNIQILPFLRELFERWNEQMIVSSIDINRLTAVLEDGVSGVVDSALESIVMGTPDEVCLEKMETLSLQEPGYAVKAFVPDNGENFLLESEDEVNNTSAILRAELSDRRWKRRRSVENTTILRILFELLYKNHPQLLLDLVDMTSKSVGEGASKDEATLQDLQDCVREFILDFLPNVWSEKECDIQRIKIHAQILLLLGLQRDALEIFLQRKLWREAVELYVEITRASTDILVVCQLYEMLLSGLLRGSGTSQKVLLTKVFEMKPQMIQIQTVLELCLTNTSEKSMEDVFKEHCLTVGETKRSLLHFLPQT